MPGALEALSQQSKLTQPGGPPGKTTAPALPQPPSRLPQRRPAPGGGCKAGDARGPPGIWAEGIVPAAPRALLLEGLLPSLLGEEAPTARP